MIHKYSVQHTTVTTKVEEACDEAQLTGVTTLHVLVYLWKLAKAEDEDRHRLKESKYLN